MNRRHLAVTLIVAPFVIATPPTLAFRDKDCSDFRTQRQAQRFFRKARKRTGERDAHGLDADGDGRACEDLPRR